LSAEERARGELGAAVQAANEASSFNSNSRVSGAGAVLNRMMDTAARGAMKDHPWLERAYNEWSDARDAGLIEQAQRDLDRAKAQLQTFRSARTLDAAKRQLYSQTGEFFWRSVSRKAEAERRLTEAVTSAEKELASARSGADRMRLTPDTFIDSLNRGAINVDGLSVEQRVMLGRIARDVQGLSDGLVQGGPALLKVTGPDGTVTQVPTQVYKLLNDGALAEVADPRREGGTLRVNVSELSPIDGPAVPLEPAPTQRPKLVRAAERGTTTQSTKVPKATAAPTEAATPAPKLAETAKLEAPKYADDPTINANRVNTLEATARRVAAGEGTPQQREAWALDHQRRAASIERQLGKNGPSAGVDALTAAWERDMARAWRGEDIPRASAPKLAQAVEPTPAGAAGEPGSPKQVFIRTVPQPKRWAALGAELPKMWKSRDSVA
ncbi:MAG: hypothetical protein EB027_07235, partial [Actinobacteria bacterium]|nr:hypothetical protein [Actinomycetota bacterium]